MLSLSRKSIWTLQPKLSPISYSLWGKPGSPIGLTLQAAFPDWITSDAEALCLSDTILSAFGLRVHEDRDAPLGPCRVSPVPSTVLETEKTLSIGRIC